MEKALALQFINRGEKLAFVSHMGSRTFIVRFKYDPDFAESLRIIPSWKSVYIPDPTGYKPKGIFQGYSLHCLDLPLLEARAISSGYKVDYESTDAVRAVVADYKNRKAWKTAPLINIPLKRPLRDRQIVGAQFMYQAGSAINCDSMGSGKSCQIIGAIKLNEINGKSFKTLVLCPKSVKGAWNKEFAICTDYNVTTLESSMENRYAQYENMPDTQVAISSFDSFISDYKEIAKAFKPDILVLDEAQRICNKDNKLTQILIGGKGVRDTFIDMASPHSRYLLTGTPIGNELEDLYPLFKLLDGELLNWLGFRSRYCLLEEGRRWKHPSAEQKASALSRGESAKAIKASYYSVIGYQNDRELKARLQHYMIRRTKDEMLPERKGKKRFHVVDIVLDPEERAIYEALKIQYQADIRGHTLKVENALGWLVRAQQICDSLEITPNSLAKKSTKLEMLLRLVKEEAPNRKIVIFSKFKMMTDIIVRELKRIKIKSVYLNGDVEDDDRQPMIDKFQTDDSVRVFVSTLQAGGVGITLTAASLCVLYDRHWAPGGNFQAIDRLDRMGQTEIVDVVFLRVKDSVEEHIEKTWLNKQGMVIGMVGDDEVLKALTDEERKILWLSDQEAAYGDFDEEVMVKKMGVQDLLGIV